MKANELKIGNFVEIDQYPNDRVIIQIENGLNIDQCGKLNASPIPLTEEWLLKFGFERKGYTSSNGSKLVIHHKELMYPKGRIYYNSWAIKDEMPQHVHQLQNLYFALTGEELTYEGNK